MRVYGTVDRNVSISPRFPDGGACRGYARMSNILNVQRFSGKNQQRPASRDVHFLPEKKTMPRNKLCITPRRARRSMSTTKLLPLSLSWCRRGIGRNRNLGNSLESLPPGVFDDLTTLTEL